MKEARYETRRSGGDCGELARITTTQYQLMPVRQEYKPSVDRCSSVQGKLGIQIQEIFLLLMRASI